MSGIIRDLYVDLARKEHASVQVVARAERVSLSVTHGPVGFHVGDLSVTESLALADALIEAARLAGPATAQDEAPSAQAVAS